MIFKNFNYDYDKEKVIQEIISCRDLFSYIPPYIEWIKWAKKKIVFMVESEQMYDEITYQDSNGVVEKKLKPPMSFYMKNSDFKNISYLKSKTHNTGGSIYNPEIGNRLEYTKEIIEQLPFENISLIRVFMTENTFLPTHNDGRYGDKSRNLGVSLVPVHSGAPLKYFDKENNKVESIFSSAFMFDDSCLHGIPMVDGIRIDIRIFGNLKKNFLKDKI